MAKVDKVLVYHYRRGGSPAVKDGLEVITKTKLSEVLADNPRLQSSRKTIPRGAMSVDIHQRDLLTESQAVEGEQHPNAEQNMAGVKLPLSVWLGNTFAGKHTEMVILSKKL